jgi:hypothetical protein
VRNLDSSFSYGVLEKIDGYGNTFNAGIRHGNTFNAGIRYGNTFNAGIMLQTAFVHGLYKLKDRTR